MEVWLLSYRLDSTHRPHYMHIAHAMWSTQFLKGAGLVFYDQEFFGVLFKLLKHQMRKMHALFIKKKKKKKRKKKAMISQIFIVIIQINNKRLQWIHKYIKELELLSKLARSSN